MAREAILWILMDSLSKLIPLSILNAYLIIVDSYSPFAYVKFPTIEASNACGPVGGKYTSVTWSYAPGELSTVEGRLGPSKSFNFADLPCPPPAVAAADWYNYYPGERYSPIIAPVPQLYKLDPAFANCTLDIYQGYDPPSALTPQTALTPSTTQAAIAQSYVTTLPIPQPQVTPSGPVQTISSLAVNQPKTSTASQIDPDDPSEPTKESDPAQPGYIQDPFIQTLSTIDPGYQGHSTPDASAQSHIGVDTFIQDPMNTAAGGLSEASSAGQSSGTPHTLASAPTTATGLGGLTLSGLEPTGTPTRIPTSTATEANGTVQYFYNTSGRISTEWTGVILPMAIAFLSVQLW